MDNIDFLTNGFTYRKIIPDVDNELTTLWGIKIVKNAIGGYALLGTAIVEKSAPTFVGIPINKFFTYPPFVHIMWKHQEDTFYSTIRMGDRNNKEIGWGLSSGGLVITNGYTFRESITTVIFKLHGI